MWTILKHKRDTVGDFQPRVLIHIPIGFLIIISVLAHWSIPICLTLLFLLYQKNEDIHTSDEAWKDLFGAIVGAIIAGLFILALRCFVFGFVNML